MGGGTDEDILTLYNTMYDQALRYNIFLVPCGSISTTSGIINQDLPFLIQAVIDKSLGTTFREGWVISKNFKIVHNLLVTNNNNNTKIY